MALQFVRCSITFCFLFFSVIVFFSGFCPVKHLSVNPICHQIFTPARHLLTFSQARTVHPGLTVLRPLLLLSMPPEPTKGKLKRKASRREIEEYRFDGGHAREIEQKRNNGQISCAECRRCDHRACYALMPFHILT